MTSIRPVLALSVASPAPAHPLPGSAPSAQPHGRTRSQRAPSWGSENGSFSRFEGEMEGLPSPAPREWDGLNAMRLDGVARVRNWEVQTGNQQGDWSYRGQRINSEGSVDSAHPRSPPTSSNKTSSFFDAEPSDNVLSPPPNPLSRNGSLRTSTNTAPTTSVASTSGGSWRGTEGSSTGGSWLERADDPDRPPVVSRRLTDSPVDSPGSETPSRQLSRADSTSSSHRLPSLPSFPSISTTISPRKLFSPSDAMSTLPTPVESPSSTPSRGARFLNFTRKFGTSNTLPHPLPSALNLAIPSPVEPLPSPSDERFPGGLSPDDESEADPAPKAGDTIGSFTVVKLLGKGAFSRVALATRKGKEREIAAGDEGKAGELVALKMIAKRSYEGNERMRISVVREVEVLKHIHHPSLVSLSSSFSTTDHTILVLDYLPGGELFDFLADWHHEMTEGLARRMFGELCGVVAWMHSIGLVHRDIKLENILLTARPFPCANLSNLPANLPTPILKLTDFGLSRFISATSPLLSTRCGSEAYAAPELIMGKKYDGRCTDAYSLGVVLYALITGGLPFVENEGGLGEGRGRRSYLMKIAKGEYTWPTIATEEEDSLPLSPISPTSPNPPPPIIHPPTPVAGSTSSHLTSLITPAVKQMVSSFLKRDPEKRAKPDDVWDMEWMWGEGKPERVSGWVSEQGEGERGSVEGSWERRDEGE